MKKMLLLVLCALTSLTLAANEITFDKKNKVIDLGFLNDAGERVEETITVTRMASSKTMLRKLRLKFDYYFISKSGESKAAKKEIILDLQFSTPLSSEDSETYEIKILQRDMTVDHNGEDFHVSARVLGTTGPETRIVKDVEYSSVGIGAGKINVLVRNKIKK